MHDTRGYSSVSGFGDDVRRYDSLQKAGRQMVRKPWLMMACRHESTPPRRCEGFSSWGQATWTTFRHGRLYPFVIRTSPMDSASCLKSACSLGPPLKKMAWEGMERIHSLSSVTFTIASALIAVMSPEISDILAFRSGSISMSLRKYPRLANRNTDVFASRLSLSSYVHVVTKLCQSRNDVAGTTADGIARSCM